MAGARTGDHTAAQDDAHVEVEEADGEESGYCNHEVP